LPHPLHPGPAARRAAAGGAGSGRGGLGRPAPRPNLGRAGARERGRGGPGRRPRLAGGARGELPAVHAAGLAHALRAVRGPGGGLHAAHPAAVRPPDGPLPAGALRPASAAQRPPDNPPTTPRRTRGRAPQGSASPGLEGERAPPTSARSPARRPKTEGRRPAAGAERARAAGTWVASLRVPAPRPGPRPATRAATRWA